MHRNITNAGQHRSVGWHIQASEFFDRTLECDPRYKEVVVALAIAVDRFGFFKKRFSSMIRR
jgi:hypothetical protein